MNDTASTPGRSGSAPAGTTGEDRERDILETMVRLADTLTSEFDQLEVLQDLTDSCVRILDADTAGVSLRDGEELRFVMATSERMELIELFQSERDEGPCYEAFHSGEHVGVSDLTTAHGRWQQWTPRALELGFRAADAFPLRLRHETIGALNVYARRQRRLDARDVTVGHALADIATVGMLQERAIADRDLVREQLQAALDSRVVIEQAKGIIAERRGVPVDEAFELVRAHARSRNQRLRDVVEQIVRGTLDVPDL